MARKPHRGKVSDDVVLLQDASRDRDRGDEAGAEKRRDKPPPGKSGRWRPDVGFDNPEGVRVTMRRDRGLTDRDFLKVPFRFQVPPLNELERPHSYPWPEFETVGAGQRRRDGGGRTLQPITFQTLFVDEPYPWLVWTGEKGHGRFERGIYNSYHFVHELEAIVDKGVIFRLVIKRPPIWGGANIADMTAVLTEFTPIERAGELGTEYANCTFGEYRELELDRKRRGKRKKDNDQRQKHKVRPGKDSLKSLAKQYYGDPSLWQLIARENGIKNVSPRSEEGLAEWVKANDRGQLTIPPKPDRREGKPMPRPKPRRPA